MLFFYDRVLANSRPTGLPFLLGHVLAHEIGHILQGVERHSSAGVMKEKWDYRDYVENATPTSALYGGGSSADPAGR